MAVGCKQISRKWEIKSLEVKAILEGLKEYLKAPDIANAGFKPPLIVESNASEAIRAINRELEDLSDISLIVDEIRNLGFGPNVLSFLKCSREKSLEAHNLEQGCYEW